MKLLVAEDENKIIAGYILFSHKPQLRFLGHSVEVDELSVSTKFRGKGVGTLLMNAVKIEAEEIKAKRIILSTNRERESYMRGFYSKLGYKELNSAWMKLELH